jgi:hypothetical protein
MKVSGARIPNSFRSIHRKHRPALDGEVQWIISFLERTLSEVGRRVAHHAISVHYPVQFPGRNRPGHQLTEDFPLSAIPGRTAVSQVVRGQVEGLHPGNQSGARSVETTVQGCNLHPCSCSFRATADLL